MGTMALHSRLFLAPLLAVAACAAPDTQLDIATNDRIYVDVPFSTRVPGDRELFVAPLADVRTFDDLPEHEGGFPINYGSDQVWERPVRDMIDEVLTRQVAESRLFAAVVERASADSLVLSPRLVQFTTGAVESVSGARAFAEVGLHLQVFGPVDAAGKRPVLLDETFTERQITPPSMRPPSPYLLAGSALRATIQKTLTGLDGSNVGRTHVPAAPTGH